VIVHTEIRIMLTHDTVGDCGPDNVESDLRNNLNVAIMRGLLLTNSAALLDSSVGVMTDTVTTRGSGP